MPLDSYEICCWENAPSSDEIYWAKDMEIRMLR